MIVVKHVSGPTAGEEAVANYLRGHLATQDAVWSVEVMPDAPPVATEPPASGPDRPASWRQLTTYDLPFNNRDNSLSSSDAMLRCNIIVPAETRFCGVAFMRRELRLFALSPASATGVFESREIEIHRESSTVATSRNDPRGLIGLAVLDDYAYLVFERTKPKC